MYTIHFIYFMPFLWSLKPQEVQVARLPNLLGPDGLKLNSTFKIDKLVLENVLKSLKDYCVRQNNNQVMEHH